MINWYEDDNLAIEFNDTPKVCIRYALPSMTKIEKKQVEKYPFRLKIELIVRIIDKKNRLAYRFTIPKGYCWNGADIPSFVWSMLGISRTSNEVLIASCLHDYMCDNHNVVNNNRKLSSDIFKCLLLEAGVGTCKSNIMSFFVNKWQIFCGW